MKTRLLATAAAAVIALTLSWVVKADQAAYVTEREARAAVELLKEKNRVKHFCEPCGDDVSRTEKISKIEALKVDYEDYWQVFINGKGVDLAYLYFESKKCKWKNVAKELDLDVEDVSKYMPDEATE